MELLFRPLVVSDSFVIPWTVARQAPLSMGFSRQEYWSGLPCPPPGDLPNLGIKTASPALQADSLPLSQQGSSQLPVVALTPWCPLAHRCITPIAVSVIPGPFPWVSVFTLSSYKVTNHLGLGHHPSDLILT